MRHATQRLILGFRAAAICLAASAACSCVSIDPGSFLPEPGYYYGVGAGLSMDEAAEAAKLDLITNALSATRDRRGTRGARIELGAEAARGFELPRLRPYAREKAADSVSIAYRMKIEDWDVLEGKREDRIRAELAPRIQALEAGTGGTLAERMREAAGLLGRLKEEGLTELLTQGGPGTPLVSFAIESLCRVQAGSLTFTVAPPGGFLEGGSALSVRVTTRDGKSPGSLALRAGWTAEEVEPAVVLVTTDTEGVARLELPPGETFRNRAVRLAVSTNLSAAAPFSGALQAVDAGSTVEYRYRHFDDVTAYFSTQASVPAGPFIAGAPARDRRASRKEAPRAVETREFLIDRHPVTNALYGMFLDDTRSGSFPEYWDNPAYNQDDQPVIGVTWEDANRFAAWLSERLGVVKRLPTEDEWEKAARAGQDVIYPWGDQSPAEGARANYGGNGRFTAPSPVGSFAAGANAYGLLDMAGNVWQWTSTAYNAGGGAATVIVKGGSWMDGPTDLRISNRRDVDPARGYVDVGFRLVTEVVR